MRKEERVAMRSLEIESKIFENNIKMLYYKVLDLRIDNELTEEEVNICFRNDDNAMFVYAMCYSYKITPEDVKRFIKDMVKALTEERDNTKANDNISRLNPDNFGEKE